jgi:hypothetical protein
MALVVKQKEFELMTEGLHNVTITRIEDLGKVDTQYGVKEKARIFFTAQDQNDKEGKPVDAVMSVNCVLGAKSTLGKLLNSLGVTPGDEFDLNDLVGIKCQVVIQHNENDGKTYANIATVLKSRKTTSTEV